MKKLKNIKKMCSNGEINGLFCHELHIICVDLNPGSRALWQQQPTRASAQHEAGCCN